jgi:DNA-binding transcriptional MerR regulator
MKTKDVCDKFAVSRETVRGWSQQFQAYLSPGANPEKGSQRVYSDDDLSVFALIATMRNEGASADTIAAALASGQRGIAPTESQIALPADAGTPALKRKIIHLVQELEDTRALLLKSEGKVELLQQQLGEKEAALRALYREIARLEAGQG